jgi:predicted membrane protein
MKMGFINSGAFWGIIIILIGVSMVMRYVFNIHFPIFRIVFAFLLIFWGVRMLMGSFGISGFQNSVVFSEANYKFDGKTDEYSVVFGKGVLDLRNTVVDKNQKIRVNSVFGSYIIRINDSIPVMIISNVAFGSIQTPDDNDSSFGKYTFRSSNYNENSPHITVDANVVFGSLKVSRE